MHVNYDDRQVLICHLWPSGSDLSFLTVRFWFVICDGPLFICFLKYSIDLTSPLQFSWSGPRTSIHIAFAFSMYSVASLYLYLSLYLFILVSTHAILLYRIAALEFSSFVVFVFISKVLSSSSSNLRSDNRTDSQVGSAHARMHISVQYL